MQPPDMSSALPLVEVQTLGKAYSSAAGTVSLFCNLSLTVSRGELLAIVGRSGSGKSTLLHLLAAMDAPSAGSIRVNGIALGALTSAEQARFRGKTIGFVWQQHHLLPEFSALENAAMPLLAQGVRRADALLRAEARLRDVELQHRQHHLSGELSGGEQQRVSIARALVTDPPLLLLDEPTGNLDSSTAELVFALLQRLHRDRGLTTVMVTHNLSFARRCTRGLLLAGGELRPFETGEGAAG